MKHEQLTAWALDELSPEEKLQVEAALQADAEAQRQAAQTKEFCDFLSTQLFDSDIALEDAQRAALQNTATEGTKLNPARTAARPPHDPRSRWGRPLLRGLAAAAVIAALATSTWILFRDLDERQSGAVAVQAQPADTNRLPTIQADYSDMTYARPVDLAATSLPFGPLPSGPPETPDSIRLMMPEDTRWSSLSSVPDVYSEVPAQSTPGNPLIAAAGQLNPVLPIQPGNIRRPWQDTSGSSLTPQEGRGQIQIKSGSGTISGVHTFGGTIASGAPAGAKNHFATGTLTPRPLLEKEENASGKALAEGVDGNATLTMAPPTDFTAEVGKDHLSLSVTAASAPAPPAASLPALAAAPATAAVPSPARQRPPGEGALFDQLGAQSEVGYDTRYYFRSPPDAFPDAPVKPSAESYTRIIENSLQDVTRAPLSTFSIDVDTAAYANVRRFLNQNTAPPADAVRIEELINYFPTHAEGPAPQAKEPFAVSVEMAECPWQPQHRLARIAIKGRELGQERKPSNLVFLVDVSGSMNEPNKLPLVQQSLRLLAEQLGEEDRVSMVVYAGSSGLVLPPTNGLNKADIVAAIDRLRAGGSTHGSAGLRLAYEQAVSGYIQGGVNRVILCTDGDFNVGISTPEELERLITEKARSGVFLSVLGYGAGNLKDRTMETLADKGNGNYAYIDSLSEARKVLVEQMGGTLVTIAKDVKIQVEFNPRVVRSYRLIGYENRLLAKEDFNDDTKDAGEIGAGHNVTALYELVPANLPPGADPRAIVDDLKYQPRNAPPAAPAPAEPISAEAQANEAFTVKLRYKEPEGSTSQLIEVPVTDSDRRVDAASAEFKFTAAVAGFGLLLRHSSYAGSLTWDQVRALAQQGKGSDPHGYRGEFLQLIEKARGVSGR